MDLPRPTAAFRLARARASGCRITTGEEGRKRAGGLSLQFDMGPTLENLRESLLHGVSIDALDEKTEAPGRPNRRKRWFFSRTRGEELGRETENPSEEARGDFEHSAVSIVAEANTQLSAQITALQEVVNPLVRIFEQFDSFQLDVSELLTPIETFCQKMNELGQQFGPVTAFNELLAHIAAESPSFCELRDTLSRMSDAFHDHLLLTAGKLQSLGELRTRVVEVSHELEQLSELAHRFDQLSVKFDVAQALPSAQTVTFLAPTAPVFGTHRIINRFGPETKDRAELHAVAKR